MLMFVLLSVCPATAAELAGPGNQTVCLFSETLAWPEGKDEINFFVHTFIYSSHSHRP